MEACPAFLDRQQPRSDRVGRRREVEDGEAARSPQEQRAARPAGGVPAQEVAERAGRSRSLPGAGAQAAGDVERDHRQRQVRGEDGPGRRPVLRQVELVRPPGRKAPPGGEVAADEDGLRDRRAAPGREDGGEVGQRPQGEEGQRRARPEIRRAVDPVRRHRRPPGRRAGRAPRSRRARRGRGCCGPPPPRPCCRRRSPGPPREGRCAAGRRSRRRRPRPRGRSRRHCRCRSKACGSARVPPRPGRYTPPPP